MLALTSNEGAFDFRLYPQLQEGAVGQELYKQVLETSKSWKNAQNLMYVVRLKPEYFTEIRKF
jgi:orotidine-5'-phosphate decarboxylase